MNEDDIDLDFLLQLLRLVGRDRALETRKRAMLTDSYEVMETYLGQLLGGKVTMRLEFNCEKQES